MPRILETHCEWTSDDFADETSFTEQFKGARSTGAGRMGGRAACVSARANVAGKVALCTWADSDTFGLVASPTMDAVQLGAQMRTIRPSVEHPAT